MKTAYIPIINKPTRVTNKTSTVIDHILTNSYSETIFKTVILNLMFQIISYLPYRTISEIVTESYLKLFTFAKNHLMNNLSSVLKRTFLKLIGKKLKLYKLQWCLQIVFKTVSNVMWYFFSTKKNQDKSQRSTKSLDP